MHEVTGVEKIRGRVQVTIDETEKMLVPLSLFRQNPLDVGQEIDLDAYQEWLTLHQYEYAMGKAAEYLAGRAHSSKEVYDRILRAGCLPTTAELVVYKLKKVGYLNDSDFAKAWVHSRVEQKYGKSRIIGELLRKGIEKEEIENAFAALDEDATRENARLAAEKLVRKYIREEPFKGKQKLINALVRRGYGWDEAKEAALSAWQENQ